MLLAEIAVAVAAVAAAVVVVLIVDVWVAAVVPVRSVLPPASSSTAAAGSRRGTSMPAYRMGRLDTWAGLPRRPTTGHTSTGLTRRR